LPQFSHKDCIVLMTIYDCATALLKSTFIRLFVPPFDAAYHNIAS